MVWQGDLNSIVGSHYWRRSDWKCLGVIICLLDTSDSEKFWMRLLNLPIRDSFIDMQMKNLTRYLESGLL